MIRYAELATTTNFSFLRGASHPGQLVLAALLLGHAGIGIADRNSVAGVVRAWGALREIRENGLPLPDEARDGPEPGGHARAEPPEALALTAEAGTLRARAESFKLVVGARLVFADGTPDILAYPRNRDGWGRLCRLLTRGKLRAKKGECTLGLDDLLAYAQNLLLIVMPGRRLADLAAPLA